MCIYTCIKNNIRETLKNEPNPARLPVSQVRNACDDLQGPVHNFDPPGGDLRHGFPMGRPWGNHGEVLADFQF